MSIYEPLPEISDEAASRANEMRSYRYYEHVKFSRNPDQFYVDVYNYHQSGGFWAIFLSEILWTIKFTFVVFVGTELSVCTRWEVLTNNSNTNNTIRQWDDVFVPPGQCWASLPLLPSLMVTGAVIGLLIQFVIVAGRLRRYWETRLFCSRILNMPTSATDLADLTWSEVKSRLIESQLHTTGLDDLSIHHRILRHENYLIAMIDQDVLPVRFRLSSSDSAVTHVYLPSGYLFNLKLLLFWIPWAPFCQHWQLQSQYKEITRRQELALHLGKMARILGILNLLFSPIILLAQLLVFICSNAERIRYKPASILGRRWSNYAHFYLRHYNELPHQFSLRISMAYEPACQYLNCFTSRNLVNVAETCAFVLGSCSVAFFIMAMIHDQLLHLTGYWAILVFGGLLARACLSYIPNEHEVHLPKTLLINILGSIHRVREHWIEQAATSRVCAEFSQLFQYRLCGALEDLFSATLTPFLLFFVVPNHTLDIVDFLRNYTVELKDLGDVCSFAELDIRRHGDPQWKFFGDNASEHEPIGVTDPEKSPIGNIDSQNLGGTWGKTELSLMYFHLNNPTCALPQTSRAYLQSIKTQILKDLHHPPLQSAEQTRLQTANQPVSLPFTTGLLSSLYETRDTQQPSATHGLCSLAGRDPHVSKAKNVAHLPGPSYLSSGTLGFVGAMVESMKNSMHQSDPGTTAPSRSDDQGPQGISPTSLGDAIPADSQTTPSVPSVGAINASVSPFTAPSSYALPRDINAINNSLMAASALYCAQSTCHTTYKPFVSQIENGSSQIWGANGSSVLGFTASRYGLTEMLTADTSASILYMHELAQRRRLQQSTIGHSTVQQRSVGPGSYGVSGDPHSLNYGWAVPYQAAQIPGIQACGGVAKSSVHVARPANDRAPSSRTSYGTTGNTSNEPVGIVRTSLDTCRFQRQLVSEVDEEEDDLVGTPHGNTDTVFRHFTPGTDTIHSNRVLSSPHGPTGIVTLPNVPLRSRPVVPNESPNLAPDPSAVPPALHQETDTDHVWPDLPPTNC